jgi:hypothetical protein
MESKRLAMINCKTKLDQILLSLLNGEAKQWQQQQHKA